jgi:Kip1 ubiquitination-promoting complex protein 1
VFRDDLVQHVRLCALHKVMLYSQVTMISIWLTYKWKQDTMYSCVTFMVALLQHLSQFNPLFSYVPEFYLETLIDSFHALRRGDPSFVMTEGNVHKLVTKRCSASRSRTSSSDIIFDKPF